MTSGVKKPVVDKEGSQNFLFFASDSRECPVLTCLGHCYTRDHKNAGRKSPFFYNDCNLLCEHFTKNHRKDNIHFIKFVFKGAVIILPSANCLSCEVDTQVTIHQVYTVLEQWSDENAMSSRYFKAVLNMNILFAWHETEEGLAM